MHSVITANGFIIKLSYGNYINPLTPNLLRFKMNCCEPQNSIGISALVCQSITGLVDSRVSFVGHSISVIIHSLN